MLVSSCLEADDDGYSWLVIFFSMGYTFYDRPTYYKVSFNGGAIYDWCPFFYLFLQPGGWRIDWPAYMGPILTYTSFEGGDAPLGSESATKSLFLFFSSSLHRWQLHHTMCVRLLTILPSFRRRGARSLQNTKTTAQHMWIAHVRISVATRRPTTLLSPAPSGSTLPIFPKCFSQFLLLQDSLFWSDGPADSQEEAITAAQTKGCRRDSVAISPSGPNATEVPAPSKDYTRCVLT